MKIKSLLFLACALTPLYAVIEVDALKEAAKTWKTEYLLTDTNNNALCLNVKKYIHDGHQNLMSPRALLEEVLDTLILNPHNLGKNEQLMLSDYVIQMMVGQIKQYQPSGKSANDALKNIMAQLLIMVGDKVKGVAGAKDRFTDMIQNAPKKIAEVDDVSWTNHLANMNDAILAGIEGKQKENVNNFVRDALKPMYEDPLLEGQKIPDGYLDRQVCVKRAAEQFIKDGMSGYEIREILKGLSNIPVDRFDLVLKTAKERFINDGMDGKPISNILKGLSVLPSNTWDKSLQKIRDLLEGGDDLPYHTSQLFSAIMNRKNNVTEFLTFLHNNRERIRNSRQQGDIWDSLSLVPNPQDWQGTLAGLLNVQLNQIQVFHNQTVHDAKYEASLKAAVGKLEKRYVKDTMSLEEVVKELKDKINAATQDKIKDGLKPSEVKVLTHFFDVRMDDLAGNSDTVKHYLNLAWQALTDKTVYDLKTDKDVDDRILGWLRSGPLDAQLAYLLDNLSEKGPFKTKAELLTAIETQPDLIDKGKSCIGGSYNRLIDPLNLIHPDVNLEAGDGQIKNAQLLYRLKVMKDQALIKLKDVQKDSPEDFKDGKKLQKIITDDLKKKVSEEAKKENHLGGYSLDQEINLFIEQNLNDLKGQLGVNQDHLTYLKDEGGLKKDVEGWLDKHKVFVTDAALEHEIKRLAEQKRQDLKIELSDADKKEYMEDAVIQGMMYASRKEEALLSGVAKKHVKESMKGLKTVNMKNLKESLVKLMMKQLTHDGYINDNNKDFMTKKIQDFVNQDHETTQALQSLMEDDD